MKNNDLFFDRLYSFNRYVFISVFFLHLYLCYYYFSNGPEVGFGYVKTVVMIFSFVMADMLVGYIGFAVIPSLIWIFSFSVFSISSALLLFRYYRYKGFDYEPELYFFIFLLAIFGVMRGVARAIQYAKNKK